MIGIRAIDIEYNKRLDHQRPCFEVYSLQRTEACRDKFVHASKPVYSLQSKASKSCADDSKASLLLLLDVSDVTFEYSKLCEDLRGTARNGHKKRTKYGPTRATI